MFFFKQQTGGKKRVRHKTDMGKSVDQRGVFRGVEMGGKNRRTIYTGARYADPTTATAAQWLDRT
jgi:hypothetical protein